MQTLIDLLNKTTAVATDEIEVLTKKYFNDTYGYAGKPVKFSKAFQDMNVRTKWTEAYLMEKLPEKQKISYLSGGTSPLYLSYKDYLNYPSNDMYFKTGGFLNVDIKNDYQTPEPFNCWYSNTKSATPKTNLSWIYSGGAGTGTILHRDIWWSSAWNYLLQGKKLWIIYPATYSQSIKDNLLQYDITPNPEDYSAFLNLPCKPLTCIQNAGETIFVPGDCYHQVVNLEQTLSLTENFINETNYDLVRSYFRESGNRDNLHKIETIIREGFTELAHQKLDV